MTILLEDKSPVKSDDVLAINAEIGSGFVEEVVIKLLQANV